MPQLGLYIKSGSEADVFRDIYENFIYRICKAKDMIQFKQTQKEYENVKYIKQSENLILYTDLIQIYSQMINIFVLELCEMSLLQEIQEKLIKNTVHALKIIFDLTDGLIELRSFNLFHCDIKPSNILKTKQGNYKISDYGQTLKLKDQQVSIQTSQIQGFTDKYFPNELNHCYYNDLYAFYVTIRQVVNFIQDTKLKDDIISILENIISDKDFDCLRLPKLFIECILKPEYNQFLKEYFNKIDSIIYTGNLRCDINRNVIYSTSAKIQYQEVQIQIAQYLQGKISYFRQFSIQYNIGRQYFHFGDFENAKNRFNIILQSTQNYELLQKIYKKLGKILFFEQQYYDSLNYFEKSLEILLEIGDQFDYKTVEIYQMISQNYYFLGDTKSGDEYFDIYMTYKPNLTYEQRYQQQFYNNIINQYLNKNKIILALKQIHNSLSFLDFFEIDTCNAMQAEFYFLTGKLFFNIQSFQHEIFSKGSVEEKSQFDHTSQDLTYVTIHTQQANNKSLEYFLKAFIIFQKVQYWDYSAFAQLLNYIIISFLNVGQEQNMGLLFKKLFEIKSKGKGELKNQFEMSICRDISNIQKEQQNRYIIQYLLHTPQEIKIEEQIKTNKQCNNQSLYSILQREVNEDWIIVNQIINLKQVLQTNILMKSYQMFDFYELQFFFWIQKSQQISQFKELDINELRESIIQKYGQNQIQSCQDDILIRLILEQQEKVILQYLMNQNNTNFNMLYSDFSNIQFQCTSSDSEQYYLDFQFYSNQIDIQRCIQLYQSKFKDNFNYYQNYQVIQDQNLILVAIIQSKRFLGLRYYLKLNCQYLLYYQNIKDDLQSQLIQIVKTLIQEQIIIQDFSLDSFLVSEDYKLSLKLQQNTHVCQEFSQNKLVYFLTVIKQYYLKTFLIILALDNYLLYEEYFLQSFEGNHCKEIKRDSLIEGISNLKNGTIQQQQENSIYSNQSQIYSKLFSKFDHTIIPSLLEQIFDDKTKEELQIQEKKIETPHSKLCLKFEFKTQYLQQEEQILEQSQMNLHHLDNFQFSEFQKKFNEDQKYTYQHYPIYRINKIKNKEKNKFIKSLQIKLLNTYEIDGETSAKFQRYSIEEQIRVFNYFQSINDFKELQSINFIKIIRIGYLEQEMIAFIQQQSFSPYELYKKDIVDQNQLLKIIFDLLDALIELRLQGIVHFDINISNLVRNKSEYFKLKNFGSSIMIEKTLVYKNNEINQLKYFSELQEQFFQYDLSCAIKCIQNLLNSHQNILNNQTLQTFFKDVESNQNLFQLVIQLIEIIKKEQGFHSFIDWYLQKVLKTIGKLKDLQMKNLNKLDQYSDAINNYSKIYEMIQYFLEQHRLDVFKSYARKQQLINNNCTQKYLICNKSLDYDQNYAIFGEDSSENNNLNLIKYYIPSLMDFFTILQNQYIILDKQMLESQLEKQNEKYHSIQYKDDVNIEENQQIYRVMGIQSLCCEPNKMYLVIKNNHINKSNKKQFFKQNKIKVFTQLQYWIQQMDTRIKKFISGLINLINIKQSANIINCKQFYFNNNSITFILVYEKFKHNLEQVILNKQLSNINESLMAIFDVLDGVIELKMNEIIHFDINLSNILQINQYSYKLAGFGYSQRRKDFISIVTNQNNKSTEVDIKLLYEFDKQNTIKCIYQIVNQCILDQNLRTNYLNYIDNNSQEKSLYEIQNDLLQYVENDRFLEFLSLYFSKVSSQIKIYESLDKNNVNQIIYQEVLGHYVQIKNRLESKIITLNSEII